MFKYKRLLLPALLAAGAMVLTACDLGASAADGKQGTSTTAAGGTVNPADKPVDEGSVDCGRSDVDSGDTFRLVVDPGVVGLVNCYVAFDVFNDYMAIPEDARKEGVTLANDWYCYNLVEADVLLEIDCSKTDPSSPTADLASDYQFRVVPVK